MLIFPAIDLFAGKAVRLYKGRYEEMTVYSDSPLSVAEGFCKSGASWVHMVDLEGARDAGTPNFSTVESVVKNTPLKVEVGGGIRTVKTIERYLSLGVARVILGTAAATDRAFLEKAAADYGGKIAVGADIRDGRVALKGWTELSDMSCEAYCDELSRVGIRTLICTDISRDGAMMGANAALYEQLAKSYGFDIIASGGVSSLADVRRLGKLGLYGAIIGKALYTGDIKLSEAIAEAEA